MSLSNNLLRKVKKLLEDTPEGRNSRNLAIIVVFAIIILCANHVYSLSNFEPPTSGGLVYLMKSLESFKDLRSGDFFSFISAPGNVYPPLPFQITALFYLIFGAGQASTLASQGIFILILALSTYLLGKHLWNEKVALAGALLSLSIPGVAFYSRIPNTDVALAAMTTLAIYFLMKSDGFSDTKYSIFFSIAFSVGMLIKWSFVFYVALPMIVIIGGMIWQRLRTKEKQKEAFFALAGIAAYSIITVFLIYLVGGSPVLNSNPDAVEVLFVVFVLASLGLLAVVFTIGKKWAADLRSLLAFPLIYGATNANFLLFHGAQMPGAYKTRFWEVQYKLLQAVRTPYHFFLDFFMHKYLGSIFLIMALVGIILFIISKEKNRGVSLILLSMAFAILLLYLQPVYDPRYYIPFSGLLSFFVVYWIFDVKVRPLRTFLSISTAFLGFCFLFGWAALPPQALSSLSKIAIATPSPVRNENRIGEAAGWLLNEASEKKTLVVFTDESGDRRICPLLWLYYMKLHPKKEWETALVFPGVDPIYPYEKKPWGILMFPSKGEADDVDEADRQPWEKKNTAERTDAGVKNSLEGASIDQVEADDVIICRIKKIVQEIPDGGLTGSVLSSKKAEPEPGNRGKLSPDTFPGSVLLSLDNNKRGLQGIEFVRSIHILDGVTVDVYRYLAP